MAVTPNAPDLLQPKLDQIDVLLEEDQWPEALDLLKKELLLQIDEPLLLDRLEKVVAGQPLLRQSAINSLEVLVASSPTRPKVAPQVLARLKNNGAPPSAPVNPNQTVKLNAQTPPGQAPPST